MSTSTQVAVEPKVNLKAPPMFKVIYVNDDITSMEFVIDSLMDFFGYAISTAEKITNTIHTEGAATAAVLPFEMAEQKGIEVTTEARKQGFPLQVKLEPEK